jgi:hypothetical protein
MRELGFAFWAGKMGFHALGLGFTSKKKTIENTNRIKI